MEKILCLIILSLCIISCQSSNNDDLENTNTFELAGTWVYSGSIDNYDDTLTFTDNTVVEDGSTGGTYHVEYDVIEYSNENNTVKLIITAIEGSIPYSIGDEFYFKYDVSNYSLQLSLSYTDYPAFVGTVETETLGSYEDTYLPYEKE